MKTGLLVASVALLGGLAFSARTADIVKIKGEACEKFVSGQSKSSIRVRVTDKASYKAVSQIENLADVRSRMLEHDFNVIVYNLVDNYVRNLMVRTTSQNEEELCVKVTGEIPVADIESVVANYSPDTPAPEYDFKEAAGVEEEVLTEEDEWAVLPPAEPAADVLYDGDDELAAEEDEAVVLAAEETDMTAVEKTTTAPTAEVIYTGGEETVEEVSAEVVYGGLTEDEENVQPETPEEELPEVAFSLAEMNVEETPAKEPSPEEKTPVVAEVDAAAVAPAESEPPAKAEEPADEITETAYVYVGPVEFNNNTHSTKSSQVLKDMFADTEGYQLVASPEQAAYALYPKVLKAKVDSLNSQTKRIQMVVALVLKANEASVSYSEHQNRFVLFESSKNEQEVAQQLLHKLLRKAGRKLYSRIEQAEEKRRMQTRDVITPAG